MSITIPTYSISAYDKNSEYQKQTNFYLKQKKSDLKQLDTATVSALTNFFAKVTGFSSSPYHYNLNLLFQHINRNDGDFTYLKTVSSNKIAPKKSETISLSQALLSANRSELYDNIFFSIAEQRYSVKTKKQFPVSIHTIAIDVDNCPEIYDFHSQSDIIDYLKAKYPFFASFVPDFIVLSGSKGFHAYYYFKENILDNKGFYRNALRLTGFFLKADASKYNENFFLRVPYTVNRIGNRNAALITMANHLPESSFCHSFAQFTRHLEDYAKNHFLVMNGETEQTSEFAEILSFSDFFSKYGEIDEESESIIPPPKKFGMHHEYQWASVYDYALATGILKKCGDKLQTRTSKTSHVKFTENNYIFDKLHANYNPRYMSAIRYRIADLMRYLDLNKYNIKGHRNNFFVLFADCLYAVHAPANLANGFLLYLNEKLESPLPESHIHRLIKYIYANIHRSHPVHFSNYAVLTMLELPVEIVETSKCSYTLEMKQIRKKAAQERYNKKRVEERGVKKKKEQRNSKILELRSKGFTQKQIAKHLGVSERTIQRVYAAAKASSSAQSMVSSNSYVENPDNCSLSTNASLKPGIVQEKRHSEAVFESLIDSTKSKSLVNVSQTKSKNLAGKFGACTTADTKISYELSQNELEKFFQFCCCPYNSISELELSNMYNESEITYSNISAGLDSQLIESKNDCGSNRP